MTQFPRYIRAVSLAVAWAICLIILPLMAVAQQRTGPFTHTPRSVRSRKIDQQHVRLELAFDFEKQEIRGRAVHRLALLEPAREIELDAAEMKIERVRGKSNDGEAEYKFQSRGPTLTIELGRELTAGSELEL